MQKFLRHNGLIAAASIVIVLILWLPFGFNVGFQGDGWTFFDKLNTARLTNTVPPAPASRLSLNFAWQIAYAIEADSYVAVNLCVIALIIGKGLMSMAILYNLTKQRLLAFGFGMLTMLIPADTGVFYLGALTLHFVVFCWLLATYCILIYYENRRFSALLIVWIALLVSTMTAEMIFLLVTVGVLALLAKARQINRRFIIASVLYLMVPVLVAARYAVLWFSKVDGVSYQSSLLDPNITVGGMLSSVVRAVERNLVGGWFGGGEMAYAPFAIVAALIVIGGCLWLMRQRSHDFVTPTRSIPLAAFIGTGLLIIFCGIALFLPTIDRNSSMRTYYFSSIGGSLILATVSWEIARRLRRETIFIALIGVMALFGCWRLLEQHADFRDRAAAQQHILRQIIDLVPGIQPNVGVILIDDGNEPTIESILSSSLFLRGSLSLIYDTASLAAGLCLPSTPADNPRGCSFEADTLTVLLEGAPYVVSPYNRLIVLRYDGQSIELLTSLDGYVDSPVPYDPMALIIEGDPPPRAATMLADG